MGPGGIATIIAASGLLIIAVAIAYVVVRVGKLVDEASASLKVLTEDATPLLEESPLRSLMRQPVLWRRTVLQSKWLVRF
jgi:uncharacterized protein YoxC